MNKQIMTALQGDRTMAILLAVARQQVPLWEMAQNPRLPVKYRQDHQLTNKETR